MTSNDTDPVRRALLQTALAAAALPWALARAAAADTAGAQQRTLDVNGLRMHVAEQGSGPLVILCHGFPETSYSWRHQLPALAAAGFRAVAPDQRGFGETTCPPDVEAYTQLQLAADIVGLVHALGEREAVIVGHDWGSAVAARCALLRPDIFRAVGLLSVPYLQRAWSAPQPTVALRAVAGDKQFYQLYFQPPGKAETEMQADVRRTLLGMFYSASGDVPPAQRWRYLFAAGERFVDTLTVPTTLPPWLSADDLDIYTRAFERSGFRGGLNWYRNLDRDWADTAFLADAPLRQPALFVAGEVDPVLSMMKRAVDTMPRSVPNLRTSAILAGAGHWIQQERASEVNRLLIDFLHALPAPRAAA